PKSRLMDNPVLTRWRAGIAVAYEFSVCWIDGGIALHIDSAIVAVNKDVFRGLRFESSHCRAGVNQRWAAIATDNKIRSLPEDPAASSVAIVVIRDDAEILDYFE